MEDSLSESDDPYSGEYCSSLSINKHSADDENKVSASEATPLIYKSLEQDRHGTVFSSIFTLISTMVGGGLLSLPFAFEQGGFIITSLILLCALMASTHGGFLIINSKKYCQGKIKNIEDVAKVAFGSKGKFLTQFALIVTLFLCSVAYWILITDQLHPIFTLLFGKDSFWSKRIVVLTIVVIIISPFTLLRSVTSLRYTSLLSVLCVLFLSGAVVHSSIKADLGGEFKKPENPVKLWPKTFGGVITSVSLTGLVFGCHFNILPMHTELRYQTRSNKRIILYTAMVLTYLINVIVSFFGYFQFRRYIAQDITENYPADDALITTGRCGLALTLILSFPLLVFPCRATINRLIWKGHRVSPKVQAVNWKTRCLHYISNDSWTGPNTTVWVIETFVFVLISYILAFNIPQVAMVWGFVGAIGNTLIIYILPPAFYLRVRHHPNSPDAKQLAACLLMIVGALVLVLGTYQSFENVIHPIPRHWPSRDLAVNVSSVNQNTKMANTQIKVLAVFDFDHTLVDGNTDTWILELHPPCRQQMNQQKAEGLCWTDIMHSIFSVLHEQGFKKQDYESCFESLHFTEGIKETCEFLRNMNIQSIIISDSNSYFIEHLLRRDSLQKVFSSVYTNPARWNKDGRLTVERYHSHTCDRCPENLCKGEVLKTYLERQNLKTGQKFDYVVYIGDGRGDVCGALTLGTNDKVLAREGYTLLNVLQKQLEMSQGMLVPRAKVVSWKTGFDVLKEVQTLLNSKMY